MGTNYYVRMTACDKCGRGESVHLGKASAGWRFHFRVNPQYKNVAELRKWLKGKSIFDEYGRTVTYKDFWKMVDAKQKTATRGSEPRHDANPPGGLYPEEVEIDGYSFFDHDFS